jgi:hypothetical protein
MDSHAKRIVAAAVMYRERFGFSVIPMGADKKPAVLWKEFQTRRATIGEILDWPSDNLAVVTGAISGIVIVDCEAREDALWFYNHRCKTPGIVQTKRGFHLYYKHTGRPIRNAQKVQASSQCQYDVRGDGGYALLPPSRHSEGNYRWHKQFKNVADLPAFDPAWRPEYERPEEDRDRDGIRDVYRYIAKIYAVSGSCGHNKTFEVARLLCESGMSEEEALGAISSWNATNAEPPWSERELKHKIRQAYR